MALVLSVLEQGMIYAIVALEYISHIKFWIFGLDRRRQLPTGSCHYGCYDHQRVHPLIALVVSLQQEQS